MSRRDQRRTRGPLAGGIDPSAFESSVSERRAERKTRQLCREARDALSIALSTLDDEVLLGAWVAEVLPGADASQLRVIVVAAADASTDDTLSALRRASGLLRSELAQALSRKRTPNLTFEVHKEDGP